MKITEKNILFEEDCDDSFKTKVKAGKKSGPNTGWAIRLDDLSNFFNVRKYEHDCHIWIKGILSKCRIRVNPRVFYKDKEIYNHLATLDNDDEVSLELKFNRRILDNKIKEFDCNLDYINTQLTVGKSYSSKGWGLSKDVVAKLVPYDAYNYDFPMIIDGIKSHAKFDIQTRLFYNSDALSEKLKELHDFDPKQKVDARILLEQANLDDYQDLAPINVFNTCSICGKLFSHESGENKCPDCLDKEITTLRLQDLLKFVSPGDEITVDGLRELGLSRMKIGITISKLLKYNLLTEEIDGSFILKNESVLNNFIKNWDKNSKDHLKKGLIPQPKLEVFDSRRDNSSESIENSNFKIVSKLGKFDLLKIESRNKLVGRFSSDNTANFVKEILDKNNSDINYFKDNNIFSIKNKYYVFSLRDGLIKFLGMFESKELAEKKLDKFNNVHNDAKENYVNTIKNEFDIVYFNKKYTLRNLMNGELKVFGSFPDMDIATGIGKILKFNNWDISYFENNNIFKINDDYCIFKVVDDQIIFEGKFKTNEDAEKKLEEVGKNEDNSKNSKGNENKLPSSKNNNLNGDYDFNKTEEDFIFKSGDKYLIIKDNKTFGEFMSMDYARVVKKFLTIYNWNVEKTNELGNIFGFNDKYFILEPNDDKIDILGVFDSYGEASQELSKGNDKQRKVSKYGTNIYKGKTGFFRISKSIKGDNVNFGHFKDLKIAQFVRKILDHNDWDVDYFIENNIFKFDNEYLVFKLNRSLVKLMGVFDSLEEAKKFVDNFDDDSVMDHAVKFVYKIRGKFAVQRNLDDGTFQAKFNTLEAAISFRDYLESVDWNIDLLQDLNNILQVGDKFLVFVVNNLRGYPLGEFNSKEEALANKERLIDDFKRGIVDNKKYKTDKHIHKSNRGYSVVKRIDGILTSFGTFNTREEAIAVRDELIANNWNLDYSHENSEDSLNSDVLNEIIFRLDPWEKIVFDAINELNSDKFTFDDLKQFENKFKRFTTPDKMESKVLKNLNSLTQQGLLVKTGENSYQKLWNY